MYKKGLKAKHEKLQGLTKNLTIRFARISLGDGTGFIGGQPRDYGDNASGLL
jgi:predicted Abi (CAAX) family protease